MGGISIWQLLIIVILVVLVFGTKKLSSLGGDLGASIKGFKKAMNEDEDDKSKSTQDADFANKSLTNTHSEAKNDAARSKDNDQV